MAANNGGRTSSFNPTFLFQVREGTKFGLAPSRKWLARGLFFIPIGQMRRVLDQMPCGLTTTYPLIDRDMVAGQAGPGVTIMHQPLVAANMAHKHHHMKVARRRHSRGRRAAWKFHNPVQ